MLWEVVQEILPRRSSSKFFEIHANGIGSKSRRSATSPITWGNPVATGRTVTLSSAGDLSGIIRVKWFEQKVQRVGADIKATRAPLVPLGEGLSVTVTLAPGRRMIVAYAREDLLAVDEISVEVR